MKVNDVGDVVLEDAGRLRALADQDRLAVFTRLQRHGAADVAVWPPASTWTVPSWRPALDRLSEAGLVDLRAGQWQAPGRGLFLQLPEGDPEAARAARQLSGVMLLAVEQLPRRWVEGVEPELDDAWAGAAGLFNARFALTAEELNRVQEDLESRPFLPQPQRGGPTRCGPPRAGARLLPAGGR